MRRRSGCPPTLGAFQCLVGVGCGPTADSDLACSLAWSRLGTSHDLFLLRNETQHQDTFYVSGAARTGSFTPTA
jgi:hypothetical protein